MNWHSSQKGKNGPWIPCRSSGDRECIKFNGAFLRCKSLSKSGDDGEPEWIESAKVMFSNNMGHDFAFLSSWNILRYSPKWVAL
jgi:hypothetical protein